MLDGDQALTLAFLTDPATHHLPSSEISVMETHLSVIVLAGALAFKLKRAVRLPYVDFSSCALRYDACIHELELNRRTAPMLYRAVRRITREDDGRLAFDGKGAPVDAVVEMVRFNQEALFDRMAAQGRLTPRHLQDLAHAVADFHAGAAVAAGGGDGMARVLDSNERAFATTGLFAPDAVTALNRAFRDALATHRIRLEARAQAGKVRHCHGDLHLRNICLVEGAPVFFDCIEFDDRIATVDVLYDLAFLLMDLWRLGMRAEANLVFNRYLDECDESDGVALLPFFMATRAAIRAHVAATRAEMAQGPEQTASAEEARACFALARQLLTPVSARLVAIGGLSGTGKSTLAAAIADRIGLPPGARILSSDRIRKRLHGRAPEMRLPEEAYRPEISERVYSIQTDAARGIIETGCSAIVDAVFERPRDRERIEHCAAGAGVSFTGLWLEAAPEALLTRVAQRFGDPSDATEEVVHAQLARRRGATSWIRIPANDSISAVTARAVDALRGTAQNLTRL